MTKSAAARKRYRQRVKSRATGTKRVKKSKKSRSTGGVSGRGKYSGPRISMSDALASGAGWLGETFLDPIAKKISGRGKYTGGVGGGASMIPLFNGESDDIVINTKEFIGDIQGTTTFTCTQYQLNPTNTTLFPWLSTIAKAFDEWEMLGCIFWFRSTSATAVNSTNTALGQVIMATDYNTSNANFSSKVDMENFAGATMCRTDYHLPCPHYIECKRKETALSTLYTNTDGNDSRFYSMGNFSFATVGQQAASDIGELWVTYKIRLKKRKLSTHANSDSWLQAYNSGSSITAANPMGNGFTLNVYGQFVGATITSTASTIIVYLPNTMRFNAGSYLIMFQLNCPGGGNVTPGLSITTVGCQGSDQFIWQSNNVAQKAVSEALHYSSVLGFIIKSDGSFTNSNSSPSLTVSGFSGYGANASNLVDFMIVPINTTTIQGNPLTNNENLPMHYWGSRVFGNKLPRVVEQKEDDDGVDAQREILLAKLSKLLL